MKPIALIFLLLLFTRISALAQGAITLISPSIRNGSFEDGVLTPWAGNGIGVQSNSLFATDGSWYAAWNGSSFPLAIQNVPADPNNGLVFLLTFDARTGTPGLSTVAVQMSARAADATPLSAVVTPVSSPPLSLTEWRPYEMELRFSGSWANTPTLDILFSGTAAEPRIAYLDNVVLQQIPEPSPMALLSLSAFLCAAWLMRKRRNASGK